MIDTLDEALIHDFAERWELHTNTFHMLFEEMTITLHDVFYLLRISIVGTQLSDAREKNY